MKIKTLFSPEDDLNSAYLKLINKAKNNIHIVDYSFNMIQLVDLLNKKINNGVDVMLVLDRSQRSGSGEKDALMKMNEKLKRNTVFGDSSKDKIIHDKFTVIDGKIVESGSWNYTEVAEEEDNFIDIIKDKKRARAFNKVFWRIFNRLSEKNGKD